MASQLMSVDTDALGSILWKRALSKVKDAVVFCDDALFESLHWQLGDDAFFFHGAKQVRDFSIFESCPKGIEKAVFLTSRPLIGDSVDTIREILGNSEEGFSHVVVITTIPAKMHYFLRFGVFEEDTGAGNSMEVFQQFEDKLLEWLETKGGIETSPHCAEVLHIPALDIAKVIPTQNFCLLTSKSAKSVNPILDTDLLFINGEVESTSSLEVPHFPASLRSAVKSLVAQLDSMFEQLCLVDEVFSVGDFARCVGREMANLPMAKSRRRNLGAAADDRGVKASVIFLDRSLDLASVTAHDIDDVFSHLTRLLPPLPSHSVDVRISLQPLIPPRKIKSKTEKIDDKHKCNKDEQEDKEGVEEKPGLVVGTNAKDVSEKTEDEFIEEEAPKMEVDEPVSTTTPSESSSGVDKTDAEDQKEEKVEEEEVEEEIFDEISSSLFGCLSHPREAESSRLLSRLSRLKTKDGLNLILKSLKERISEIVAKRGEGESLVKDEVAVSGKIPVIIDDLQQLVKTARDQSLFMDVLKANLESGFGGKSDPTSQLGIWDLSLAALQAFRDGKDEVEKAESILAMEKALLQTMPDESEEESATFITNQLLKIFRRELQNVKKEKRDKKRRKDKKTSKLEEERNRKETTPPTMNKEPRLNFRDAVLLLVHVYSLCGPETGSEISRSDGEDKIKAVFSKYVEELLQLFLLDEENDSTSNRDAEDSAASLEKVLESEHEPLPLRMAMREAVRERKGVDPMVEHLFRRLKAVSQTRRNFKSFKRLYRPGSLTKPAESLPLLRQLVHQILSTDGKSPDCSEVVADIEYHSSGILKDLLKSSFSYFMGSSAAKPKPSDAAVTIIFVIGGVTTSEIRMVNELVASSSQDKQIMLWSNKLLRPDDILRTTLQPEMDFL